MGDLTLVLGGARSGKSRLAEELASNSNGSVLYLATLEPGDDEMRRRVEVHRAARPSTWRTVEEPIKLVQVLSKQRSFDVCLLDCVTLWVSNLLLQAGAADEAAASEARSMVLGEVRGLLAWQRSARSSLIVVSNEVGSGLVPEYPLGRLYRDVLGEANQLMAAAAGRAYLCVAGYALDINAAGRPIKGI